MAIKTDVIGYLDFYIFSSMSIHKFLLILSTLPEQ